MLKDLTLIRFEIHVKLPDYTELTINYYIKLDMRVVSEIPTLYITRYVSKFFYKLFKLLEAGSLI